MANKIFYTDQNNNRYSLANLYLEYKAVTTKESSSGIYSGGKNKKKLLVKKDSDEILLLADKLMKNKSTQTLKREMLTSVLTIIKNGESKSAILKRSNERTIFEDFLKKML